jgi:hypothetical protein
MSWNLTGTLFKNLPARFARLPRMAAMVVAPTAASATKTLAAAATTPGPIGLWFGLVDGQRSSAQVGSVEGRDSFIGFTGIAHFDKPETTGAPRIPIGYECDFFDRAMCFEDTSQIRFSCTVGQVSNVQVLHRNSSLNKSSRLVGARFRFDARLSESRGGVGKARKA